jgi:hypothetical protein
VSSARRSDSAWSASALIADPMAPAPMAPIVAPGKAKVPVWPSNGAIAITIEPKP